jgi:lipopolysaccharide export system permease protein
MLERTVRTSRSDREMSARDLAAERDRVIQNYDLSLVGHHDHLVQMGIPAAPLAALAPDILPWPARLVYTLKHLPGTGDPLEQLTRDRPAERAEIEMWRLERDGLRRRIASLSVEYHKKFSLPAACVVFVLIGAPLGMRVRRAGPAVAFVSIAFFLFYYLCLIGGEELANRLLLPPWLSMWLPNLVLGVWGLHATAQASDLLGRRARASRPKRVTETRDGDAPPLAAAAGAPGA